jgi:cell division protein FtsI (penicillin-binding protein 3)
VGAVKIAQALGQSAYFEMLQRFGFGRPTGSGFPDESAGVLRPWEQWRPVDHATIAFGQGVSVTAVQLAAASLALASGGRFLPPHLVAAHRVAGGRWQPIAPPAPRRVLREDTARAVLAMLETVVGPDGTGGGAMLGGVRVAGKTGTAQKWDAEEKRYSEERFRAWFVGIVPADAPRLVILTGLDEPRRPRHTGGASAAPLFAKVAAAQLARFGIFVGGPAAGAPTRVAELPAVEPEADAEERVADTAAPSAAHVSAAPAAATPRRSPPPRRAPGPAAVASLDDRVLLPDFSGRSVDEVTRITESARLIVRVLGRGRAIQQDPPPGTVVPTGGIVTIEFSEASAAQPPSRAAGGRS